jgi:polyhydroxyalkanoate synthesis regulator phasin
MPQNDMLRRYLDAGMAFTQMTRDRAEAIVKDLVKAGEVQQKQTQKRVDELVERSRANTEQLLDIVRKEITAQLSAVGIATKDDIARLEAKIAAGGPAAPSRASAPAPAPPASAPTAGVKKAAVKKSPAKKAPAKKAASAVKKA